VSDLAPQPFLMHGARDAMAAGLAHIEAQVQGIERAITENPGLAFDLAKTLVESACKAILNDRSISYSENDDLPKLFSTAKQSLPFLPPTASSAATVRHSLDRTLGGLHAAIQGICELRNQCGFASHGAGAPRPALETTQALLAAKAADALVGFLYRVHRQDTATPVSGPQNVTRHAQFDEALDAECGPFTVRDITLRPSDALFALEPETYRIYRAEFDSTAPDGAEPTAEAA
jgi:hypothetical protein